MPRPDRSTQALREAIELIARVERLRAALFVLAVIVLAAAIGGLLLWGIVSLSGPIF